MHFAITFTSSKFDVTKEDENPINPIYGQSLLLWLKDKVSDTVELDVPDAEDWGWYSAIEWKGRLYLLGASAIENDTSSYDWVFQLDKHRSFKEKILGKEKMIGSDDCLQFFKSVFDVEPDFRNVEIEES